MEIPPERESDDRWKDLHAHFVSEARDKEADVLIIGDDHVALLEQSNLYRDRLAALHCLVFGVMGDTVKAADWRVTNGEIERIPAKVVLLSIGHNDVLVSSPDEFLNQLSSLVENVHTRLPQASIFVMKLIPSGRNADSPARHWISEVNGEMEKRLRSKASVIDIDTSSIINSEGLIDRHLLFDFFHLTQEGYSLVFDNVHLALHEALNP